MLNRWQKTVVDRQGNVVPWAALMIRKEADQMPATVYRDRDGTDPYPAGQVTADGNGFVFFYTAPGLYRITGQAPAIDWRDVGIGAPFDSDALGTAAAADLIETRYDATPERVVTTGGFGLGVPDDGTLEALDVDLDTVLISGDYYCADTCTNLPGTLPGFLSVLAGGDPDRKLQRFVEDGEGGKEYRRIVDGTPGVEWQESGGGVPGMAFAEIDALTSDQGPIIATDHGGAVYVWNGSAYAPLIADETYAGALKIATTALAQGLVDDTTALTPKKLGDAMSAHVLGMGQTWQNVTASRALNTTYTNSTGRPIQVSMSGSTGASITLTINGAALAPVVYSIHFVVPVGATYAVALSGGSIAGWNELR
jgi:hypothetical protein